jgi:hypothetical protein
MNEVQQTTQTLEAEPASDPFEALERAFRERGPDAGLDLLARQLTDVGNYRGLLDALLLKARRDLGLPLVSSGSMAELAEPLRTKYEDRYVEAIRVVGSRYLEAGEIANAWAYFRVIGESGPVAAAIENFVPGDDDDRLGAIIEVALHHGAAPAKGFELILEHYGTCSAITAFEQVPAQDEGLRARCAARLIERLHRDLSANLRSEILSRGQLVPGDDAGIDQLVSGRDWLFSDESYHIDISHLASVVRMSLLVKDPAVIRQAFELTEYGRRLSPRLQFDGPPPFERIFEDHGAFLGALIGIDVDGAIDRFEGKLTVDPDDPEGTLVAAQTLVNLLARVGRLEQAIEVASKHFAGIPDGALFCPSVAQLCQRAGQPERLAEIARSHRDPLQLAMAILQIDSASRE